MSREYFPQQNIDFDELLKLDGDVRIDHNASPTNHNQICLSDGNDHLWAYRRGETTQFTAYGLNNPSKILSYLAKKFHTKIGR